MSRIAPLARLDRACKRFADRMVRISDQTGISMDQIVWWLLVQRAKERSPTEGIDTLILAEANGYCLTEEQETELELRREG